VVLRDTTPGEDIEYVTPLRAVVAVGAGAAAGAGAGAAAAGASEEEPAPPEAFEYDPTDV